jgi:hypothetical protein
VCFEDFAFLFTKDFFAGDSADDDDFSESDDEAESRAAYFAELIGYVEKQLNI